MIRDSIHVIRKFCSGFNCKNKISWKACYWMTLIMNARIIRRLITKTLSLLFSCTIVALTVLMWIKGKLSPSEGPARPQITHEDCQVQIGYYRLLCQVEFQNLYIRWHWIYNRWNSVDDRGNNHTCTTTSLKTLVTRSRRRRRRRCFCPFKRTWYALYGIV